MGFLQEGYLHFNSVHYRYPERDVLWSIRIRNSSPLWVSLLWFFFVAMKCEFQHIKRECWSKEARLPFYFLHHAVLNTTWVFLTLCRWMPAGPRRVWVPELARVIVGWRMAECTSCQKPCPCQHQRVAILKGEWGLDSCCSPHDRNCRPAMRAKLDILSSLRTLGGGPFSLILNRTLKKQTNF